MDIYENSKIILLDNVPQFENSFITINSINELNYLNELRQDRESTFESDQFVC